MISITNTQQFLGRLVSDSTTINDKLSKITIAVDGIKYLNNDGNLEQSKTSFVDIIFNTSIHKNKIQYLTKGKQVIAKTYLYNTSSELEGKKISGYGFVLTDLVLLQDPKNVSK